MKRADRRFSWARGLRGAVAAAAVCLLVLNILGATVWRDGAGSERLTEEGKVAHMRDDQRLIGDWLRRNTTGDAIVLAGPAPP